MLPARKILPLIARRRRDFSPVDISGLVMWLDAADETSITKDGSNLVSEWRDKSGNGRHMAASGSQRPTHTANHQNGLPGVVFLTTQQMTTAAQVDHNFGTGPWTMFFVHRKGVQTSGNRAIYGNGAAAPGIYERNSGQDRVSYWNGSSFVNFASMLSSGAVNVLCLSRDASNGLSLLVNGVADANNPLSISLNIANALWAFATSTAGSVASPSGCSMMEFAAYTSDLSAETKARMTSYLRSRWGV